MSKWAEWGSDHDLVLDMPRRGSCYVYIAWGEDRSRPLYVGKARNPWSRISTHMHQRPWQADVVAWEAHGFPSEGLAEAVEIEAIAHFNPIHNSMRRMTRAEWAEQHRISAERKTRKEAARAKVTAEWEATRAKRATPKPVMPAYKPRRLRRQRWRDEVFTPDQLAIIARVQNRGTQHEPG